MEHDTFTFRGLGVIMFLFSGIDLFGMKIIGTDIVSILNDIAAGIISIESVAALLALVLVLMFAAFMFLAFLFIGVIIFRTDSKYD